MSATSALSMYGPRLCHPYAQPVETFGALVVGNEDLPSLNSPGDHMMESSRMIQTRCAWHDAGLACMDGCSQVSLCTTGTVGAIEKAITTTPSRLPLHLFQPFCRASNVGIIPGTGLVSGGDPKGRRGARRHHHREQHAGRGDHVRGDTPGLGLMREPMRPTMAVPGHADKQSRLPVLPRSGNVAMIRPDQ